MYYFLGLLGLVACLAFVYFGLLNLLALLGFLIALLHLRTLPGYNMRLNGWFYLPWLGLSKLGLVWLGRLARTQNLDFDQKSYRKRHLR